MLRPLLVEKFRAEVVGHRLHAGRPGHHLERHHQRARQPARELVDHLEAEVVDDHLRLDALAGHLRELAEELARLRLGERAEDRAPSGDRRAAPWGSRAGGSASASC